MRALIPVAATVLLAIVGASALHAGQIVVPGAVVFERDAGSASGSDIFVSVGGGDATPLIATAAQEFDPALGRDGRVAFARAVGERAEIFIFNAGKLTQATRDNAIAQSPAWSPNSDRIAYASSKGKGFDILEVLVGASSAPRIVAAAPGDDITPSYGPDGRIAFASNRFGSFDLYVVGPTGKLSRLTRDGNNDLAPAWSPDGTRIAFERIDETGNADIWVLTLSTLKVSQLTVDPADDSDPVFSPDSRQVTFVSDRSGSPALWTMIAKPGSRPTPLAAGQSIVDLGPSWGAKPPVGRIVQAATASRMTLGITCPNSGPFVGTAGNDTLNGSDTSDDTICGLSGNDTIDGKGGKDTVLGGDGQDSVSGGNGSDPYVSGGPGEGDQLFGGDGADKLWARDRGQVDFLDGGPGFDRAQYDLVDHRISIAAIIP